MKLQQMLLSNLTEWKQITGYDYCVLGPDDQVLVSTGDRPLPSPERLASFRAGEALCVSNTRCSMYKVREPGGSSVLILWGTGENAATIGELAVCQVRSLMAAASEKTDKNSFFRNLLTGRYPQGEVPGIARRLHISADVPRALLLLRTGQEEDEESIVALARGLFGRPSRDFVIPMDKTGIVILRELSGAPEAELLSQTAATLVDTLNTEAMCTAWVSYGNPAQTLSALENAYQEAVTAMEIGRIFFADRSVFGYSHLGIGRLIYQLPEDVCEIFLKESLQGESLDSLDEETINIIRTFFENDLNMAETSRQLYLHRNTLIYRFEKLQKKYGLDIRSFEDALTLRLAMMVSDYLKHRRR